jgi:hypothetical protein
MLAHIPGLRVVIPSSPSEHKGCRSRPSAIPIPWYSRTDTPLSLGKGEAEDNEGVTTDTASF